MAEPDMSPLSVILEEFNQLWGTEFTNADEVGQLIAGIPELVEAKESYRDARKYPDEVNAGVEDDGALDVALIDTLQCSAELYKLFTEKERFRSWQRNISFDEIYHRRQ